MKWKATNQGYGIIDNEELLVSLLNRRGVEDVESFLDVNESYIHDGMLLKNMDRGLYMLKYHLDRGSKILIIDDVDNDGITSGAIISQYIKKINPEVMLYHHMNSGKKHGIVLDEIADIIDYVDLIIVPDAGSNDILQIKTLTEDYNKDILILDHHLIEVNQENYPSECVVINNQDGQYPNPTLSGAGVVYKFIKEYDKRYRYDYADEFLDLVAVGMIGDGMDLRNLETRYLTLKGLTNVKNLFLKEIMLKNKLIESIDEDKGIDIHFVGWNVSPLLNAVVRSGIQEERMELIKAINGLEEERTYQPRRKHKDDPKPDPVIESLQRATVRLCTNIKARQDKPVKKYVETLKEQIESDGTTNNKVIIVDTTNLIEESTLTGLVANKLANYYKRPAFVLKSFNDVKFGGSARNYSLSPIENLKELLEESGMGKGIGHENAFGINILKSNFDFINDKLNNMLKDVVMEDVYLVDYEIPVGRLKGKDILQVGSWSGIWGGEGLEEPLFAITNVTVGVEDIKLLGDKKNFIKIEKQIGANRIDFVKKFTNEEEYLKMIMRKKTGLQKPVKRVTFDIICRFTINKFNDNQYPQCEIVDYNVREADEFRF